MSGPGTPYLNPVDAAFLRMESKRTPMHVAGLLVFRLPENAGPDYLNELFTFMRSQAVQCPPFNWKLAPGWLSGLAPRWEPARHIDIEYHLRHSALPHPGGERELGVLVSRLHSQPMDMDKPLWECHLIEGLENGRFALYLKTHHAAVDGTSALKLINSWLSTDPDAANVAGPWALDLPKKPRRAADESPPRSVLGYGFRLARENLRGTLELAGSLRGMIRTEAHPEGSIGAPTDTPRTLFNQRITPHRRLATQLFELRRVKALSQAENCTINDVCLAICGGAIRRYLLERDVLSDKSLVASVPVALPRPDGRPGNRVAGFVCPVGTDLSSPRARLQRIRSVTADTKSRMKKLSDTALNQFAVLGISPLLLGQISGLLTRLPPLFNLTISNVAGSREPLYFRGARMEAMYPMSVLFDGHTLNITIVGYAEHLALGVTGCRDTIPNLQNLAVYAGLALDDLEAACTRAARAKRRKKVSHRKKRTPPKQTQKESG